MSRKAPDARVKWRDVLEVHPAADLFPPMSPDELRDLSEDIKKNGLTSPIVLWSPGDQTEKDQPVYLLDGRNRLDAMEAAGFRPATPRGLSPDFILPCNTSKSLQLHGWTHHLHEKSKSAFNIVIGGGAAAKPTIEAATDPYAYVISANIHRRHLTAEQRIELTAKLLKATPEKSNASIAKQVKVDDKTVAKVRRDLEATSEIPRLEKTTGADGKTRKKPARKTRRTEDDFKRDVQAKKAAPIATAMPGDSQGEVERLRVRNAELENESRVQHSNVIGLQSEIEDLKTALEKSATDRAELLYRALDPIKMAGLPITDQLIILIGLLFDGLAPIKELVAALRLPENASLKRQSQLEGLQALTGAVFDWMSVVREQVAEIKCALDEYAEPKASESNHDGVGEIEASPAAAVTGSGDAKIAEQPSPPVASEAHDRDASGDEQADPFAVPGFLDRRAAS